LKDVSFEVKRGEVVGIIGRNGAGKSTILKILSRITKPTKGHAQITGRVGSLLEVGTGFHPELTGRENIYLNGAILGMRKAEIERKFDDIVSFAEVEKFIDTPVKRYSSGMYVRLAFAVAAHMETEILLIDEVLAVGDVAFQKKCLGKMGDVAKQGRTVIFVSHNMGVMRTLTQNCIYLENGRVAALGKSRDIVELYLRKSLEIPAVETKDLEFYRRDRNHDSPVKITAVRLNGSSQAAGGLPIVELGAKLTFKIDLDVSKTLQGAHVTVLLKTSNGERVSLLVSWDSDYLVSLEAGRHEVLAHVGDLPLAPGKYFVDVGIGQSVEARAYDLILDFPLFCVANNGQITHWLERPWAVLHSTSVEWENRAISS